MTLNPLLNALATSLYIAVVVLGLFYGGNLMHGLDNTLFMPLLALSLFVFSAGFTAFLFMYQPLRLFMEGKADDALTLFLKTLGYFAAASIVLVGIGIFAAQ